MNVIKDDNNGEKEPPKGSIGDGYHTTGNFRVPLENPYYRVPGTGIAPNLPNPEMLAKYIATNEQESKQYGEYRPGHYTEDKDAYNKKYRSTVGSTLNKAKDGWTFNEAYSAARGEGVKTFEMWDGEKWVKYSTRRADETVEDFDKSFELGSPEQEAKNIMIGGRKRIGYGPGDPILGALRTQQEIALARKERDRYNRYD